jgi:hypothetical protein
MLPSSLGGVDGRGSRAVSINYRRLGRAKLENAKRDPRGGRDCFCNAVARTSRRRLDTARRLCAEQSYTSTHGACAALAHQATATTTRSEK